AALKRRASAGRRTSSPACYRTDDQRLAVSYFRPAAAAVVSYSTFTLRAHPPGELMHHLLSIVALVGLFGLPTLAFAQDLALKRVMLSSGGLGYFEYEANVDGDATLKLTVSLQQVDDVLKSLVVYDDKGGVGGLSLPGREPLANTFKD